MSRPLRMLLAAALVASMPAWSVAPAAAQQSGIEFVAEGHGGDWDNGWRDDRRHWRHGRRDHWRHNRPGFNFSFGVPFPRVYYRHQRPRDCYREWDGSLYCRAY